LRLNLKVNSFVLDIWDDERSKCSFYTVRYAQNESTETDNFFEKYDNTLEYTEDIQKLAQLLLVQMGDKYGATEAFFNRREDLASALPPVPSRTTKKLEEIRLDNQMRLYCLRLSDEVVILFNGGVKLPNTRAHQESPQLYTKFQEAQIFAKKILRELQSGMIVVKHRVITDFNGKTDIEII
jgi:hypothetical protein